LPEETTPAAYAPPPPPPPLPQPRKKLRKNDVGASEGTDSPSKTDQPVGVGIVGVVRRTWSYAPALKRARFLKREGEEEGSSRKKVSVSVALREVFASSFDTKLGGGP